MVPSGRAGVSTAQQVSDTSATEPKLEFRAMAQGGQRGKRPCLPGSEVQPAMDSELSSSSCCRASGTSTALQDILHLFKWVKQGPGSSSPRHSGHAHLTDSGSLTLIYLFLSDGHCQRGGLRGWPAPSAQPQMTGEGAAERCPGRTGGSACPAEPSLTPSRDASARGSDGRRPGAGTPASVVKQRPQTSLFLHFFQSGKRSRPRSLK